MTRPLIGVITLASLVVVGCSSESDSPTGPTTFSNLVDPSPMPGSGLPNCTLPPAPTNLRVSLMSGTLVELAWSPVAGATSYTLLVGSVPGRSDVLNSETTQAFFRFTARDGEQFARVQANTTCGGGPTSRYLAFTVRP